MLVSNHSNYIIVCQHILPLLYHDNYSDILYDTVKCDFYRLSSNFIIIKYGST